MKLSYVLNILVCTTLCVNGEWNIVQETIPWKDVCNTKNVFMQPLPKKMFESGGVSNTTTLKVSMVTDNDNCLSLIYDYGYSSFGTGALMYASKSGEFTFAIEKEIDMYKYKQTLELSELVKVRIPDEEPMLIAVDDRTNTIMSINVHPNKDIVDLKPWFMMPNETQPWSERGRFRAEWMTQKGDELFVGSDGRSYVVNHGSVSHNSTPEQTYDRMFVYKINVKSRKLIEVLDWTDVYLLIASEMNCENGFVAHESVFWSEENKVWVFAPRKCSMSPFNIHTFDSIGCNNVVIVNESLDRIKNKQIYSLLPSDGGFTTITPIPGTAERVYAGLVVKEGRQQVTSQLFVFDLGGKIWMNVTQIGNVKYEGMHIERV